MSTPGFQAVPQFLARPKKRHMAHCCPPATAAGWVRTPNATRQGSANSVSTDPSSLTYAHAPSFCLCKRPLMGRSAVTSKNEMWTRLSPTMNAFYRLDSDAMIDNPEAKQAAAVNVFKAAKQKKVR